MLLQQTIHHGNYYNVLNLETPDDLDEALLQLGESSPYRFKYDPSRNRFHRQLRDDLDATGAGSLGWADIKVLR